MCTCFVVLSVYGSFPRENRGAGLSTSFLPINERTHVYSGTFSCHVLSQLILLTYKVSIIYSVAPKAAVGTFQPPLALCLVRAGHGARGHQPPANTSYARHDVSKN